MAQGRVIVQLAASLDGRIADAAGGVSWLDPFPAADFDFFEPFLANVGAIVMGRTAYDRGRELGPWPYGAREVLVMSNRALDTQLSFLRAAGGAMAPAINAVKARATGDVWVMGGGKTVGQALAEDVVDVLDIVTLPVVLGGGPLWRPDGPQPSFRLAAQYTYKSGAMRVVMERAR
jgi:dihydrofolate reductase